MKNGLHSSFRLCRCDLLQACSGKRLQILLTTLFLYYIRSLSLCPLLLVSPASLIVRELSMQLISFCVGNTLNVSDFALRKDSQNKRNTSRNFIIISLS